MPDYAAKLQDSILSRSALFDDLVDQEAQIILDWAMTQAERVAAIVQDEEDYDDKRSKLGKLLKGISRLVAFRQRKDTEWYTEKLDQLTEYSLAISGPGLSVDQRTALLDHANKTNIELLNEALTYFTPPEEAELDTYTPPSTDIKTYAAPVRDIDSHADPTTDIQPYIPPERDIKPHIEPPSDIVPTDEHQGE